MKKSSLYFVSYGVSSLIGIVLAIYMWFYQTDIFLYGWGISFSLALLLTSISPNTISNLVIAYLKSISMKTNNAHLDAFFEESYNATGIIVQDHLNRFSLLVIFYLILLTMNWFWIIPQALMSIFFVKKINKLNSL